MCIYTFVFVTGVFVGKSIDMIKYSQENLISFRRFSI